jgi:photosystem II stability/assembly factor-like uncharacterized protein
MTRSLPVVGLLFVLAAAAYAQPVRSYQLAPPTSQPLPLSNVVNDLLPRGDTLWAGTERGLSRTLDAGASWQSYASVAPFDGKSISAIAMHGRTICAASAYSKNAADQTVPAGGGFYFSTDLGATWTYTPQCVDAGLIDTIHTYGATGIRSLAITTDANNITYDLALTSTAVYAANFAGMLRRSTDGGQTWQKVVLPPDGEPSFIRATDTLTFDLSPTSGNAGLLGNLNHRVFSVFASSDSVIWVGTAGGINKTTDAGFSWRKYSHQNQSRPISGNFVVAIREMRWGTRTLVWAATVNAESSDEQRGVSVTDDGGATWTTCLLGEFAHNIAVRDSIAYVATDNGVFRSNDGGLSWQQSGTIADPFTGQRFASSTAYAVATMGDTVWVAGPDGTAFTVDVPGQPFGTAWHVFRAYQPVAKSSDVYAYPTPFSPSNDYVRLHYRVGAASGRVTVRIFDFAMNPVRLLLHDASRTPGMEHDELWNGTNDSGNRVANGVYFFRVEVDGQSSGWGKVLVIE